MTTSATRLLICQDLLFTSKVTGTAKALGIDVSVVPHVTAALVAVGDQTQQVIVDLNSPATTTAEELKQLCQAIPSTAKVIAYGSHVDVDRLRSAQEAGCDLVIPRSEFSRSLVELLQG